MDGASREPIGHILDWDESDVHQWLSQLGFPQYETQIKDNNITGDILCLLDPGTIKDIGISTVGQRLAILKAIYYAKLSHNVTIEPDHYIPPSEDRTENLNVDRLYHIVKEQAERLRSLEVENRRLSQHVQNYVEDLNTVRNSIIRPVGEDSPIQNQPSFKWQLPKPGPSPTKPEMDSPHHSPQHAEHDISRNAPPRSATLEQPSKPSHSSSNSIGSQSPMPARNTRSDSSDNLKSFKVSLEDPAWKVLPAALKKYKINNDSWQNYAMFICYGSPGNRIERCLSYDEKPLLLFQKLKDAKKNPVFMLKHIKDIRSPIAVAQQKQAARRASSETPSTGQSRTSISSDGNRPSNSRPPKLQIHGHNTPAPLLSGASEKPGWPDVMTPSIESKDRQDEFVSTVTTGATTHSVDHSADANTNTTQREPVAAGAGLSYAVAIYPYMAEQEDEFDVVVGDTFIIISRARGWWFVQRDQEAKGAVEIDPSKQGWVPAGCLLETSVPVAVAIEEAALAIKSKASSIDGNTLSPVSKTPILPLSILSTSFPGIALMEYTKKGEEELDLMKDDTLRVFKRYNHWSYAVKEDTGDRGWVPSWFIGKIPTSTTPATPSMNVTMTPPGPPLESEGNSTLNSSFNPQSQVSPMSSAFPPMQQSQSLVRTQPSSMLLSM